MSTDQDDLYELLRLLVEHLGPWTELIEAPPPACNPGGDLAGDDAQTAPYHVSHTAWHALAVAVAHGRCLRSSLIGEQAEDRISMRIDPYGQAAMVRGAIENAARAVWMIGPESRLTRVTRRLAQEMKEIDHSYRLRQLVGKPHKRTREEREEQLRSLATAASVPSANLKQTLRWPGYAKIVREAGGLVQLGADPAEVAWSACSALAHGDLSGTLGLLEKQILATNDGVHSGLITGSIGGLRWTTWVAVLMIDRGFQLYRLRATR